ncbi:MAG: insulinase family protein [Burkholderiales bacterium]|nr:insulinase family protein [Burkholderiales bacterium]OJX00954.1 MAG: peptidase M16 [Burkholderiales bacterium 70-64]
MPPAFPLPRTLARTLPGFALSCAVLWLHGASAAAPAPGPTVFERSLPNGLKVVVREDRRAPTVVHLVLYRAGSMDEENGTTGVAHALEHMMFKGSKTVPAGEFSRRVAALGGRENAFTTRDYTGYFQQIGSSHLADVMALEADRMTNLVIADEEFAKEIMVVMEERRLRTDDRAQALVSEQLMASAYVASPYRTPVVGWMSDLQSMTADDVRRWYREWYTPSNAVLVVAGDVSAEEVFRLAEQTYGAAQPHALPERKPQQEPAQRGARRASVRAPAENPYVVLGFKVPRLRDVERDSEPYALEVLSAVLDADENGRMTRDLVRGSRIANQAGASYDLIARGPALFALDGTPAEGRTTAEVEQALRGEVERIAREGVREDELRRIKTQYVAAQIYKRDSLMGQAMEIGSLEMAGFSHRDADRVLERIRAVTAAEVQAVARKYFGDDALTAVTLLPQPPEPAAPRPPAAGMRQD